MIQKWPATGLLPVAIFVGWTAKILSLLRTVLVEAMVNWY